MSSGEMHNSARAGGDGNSFKITSYQWAITSYATNPEYYNMSTEVAADHGQYFGSIEKYQWANNINLANKLSDLGISSSPSHPHGPGASTSKYNPNSMIMDSSSNKVGLGILSSIAEEDDDETTKIDEILGTNYNSSASSASDNKLLNLGGRGISVRGGGKGCYFYQESPCVFAAAASLNYQNNLTMNIRADELVTAPVSSSLFPMTICRKHGNVGFLRLEEIQNTDNYTRRVAYLPHPALTHMYNNCILEFPPPPTIDHDPKKPPPGPGGPALFGMNNSKFLSNCEACNKPLRGKDIYIYRGESSFCSEECRYFKVMSDKKLQASTTSSTRNTSSSSSSSSRKMKVTFYLGDVPPAA